MAFSVHLDKNFSTASSLSVLVVTRVVIATRRLLKRKKGEGMGEVGGSLISLMGLKAIAVTFIATS